MLKREYINLGDEALQLYNAGNNSNIYRLNDGRIVKIIKPVSLKIYDMLNVDLYNKLDSSNILEGIDGVVLPLSVIIDEVGNCIGYTMNKVDGYTLNEINDRITFMDQNNLNRYLKYHKKINEIVKKCNEMEVMFPDLLTCDNIMIDYNGNINLIDIDGAQILDNTALVLSTSLGGQAQYYNNKKFIKDSDKQLWTNELDKRSLLYLFFLDVFNINLAMVGIEHPALSSVVTINDVFRTINIDDIKLQKIIKSNISNEFKGEYLDRFLSILEKKYKMFALPSSIIMGRTFDPNNKDEVYMKRLIRK